MNRDKFIEQLKRVRVPYRFSLRLNHLLAFAETLKNKPYELACLAFNFGFLQGQRAAEVEALKRNRGESKRCAKGYGLLTLLIERHMEDAEFIKWLLAHARRLDKAYQEIDEAKGQRGDARYAEET